MNDNKMNKWSRIYPHPFINNCCANNKKVLRILAKTYIGRHPEVFFQEAVLKNFSKFKGAPPCRSLVLIKFRSTAYSYSIKKRLLYRCFPVKPNSLFEQCWDGCCSDWLFTGSDFVPTKRNLLTGNEVVLKYIYILDI